MYLLTGVIVIVFVPTISSTTLAGYMYLLTGVMVIVFVPTISSTTLAGFHHIWIFRLASTGATNFLSCNILDIAMQKMWEYIKICEPIIRHINMHTAEM